MLRGAGLGGEDGEDVAGGGVEKKVLGRQGEFTHQRMPERLDLGAVGAHVVAGPPDAELLAAGRQMPDEFDEVGIVRVQSGLDAEDGDNVVGELVPLWPELPGLVFVVEQEPRRVGRIPSVSEMRVVKSPAQVVRGHNVQVGVEHHRG